MSSSTVKTVGVNISTAEGSQYQKLEIEPGTRPADVLRTLGLPETWTVRFKGKPKLDSKENVYAAIKDSRNELEIIPDMSVASAVGPREGPFTVSAPASRGVLRVVPSEASRRIVDRVQHQVEELWQARGWKEVKPGEYVGSYVTPFGSFPGKILQQGSRFTVLLQLPERPRQVDAHPKRTCLMPYGSVWQLNPAKQPVSLDGAVCFMEDFLTESFVHAGYTLPKESGFFKRLLSWG